MIFQPTPAQTIEFWRRMQQHYGTRVVQKPNSPLMRAAGQGLELIRIMSAHTFMTRYTTVIGRTIYPWFLVGHGDPEMLWRQIVVCVHEHQHVEQFKRMGMIPYAAVYAGSPLQRALLEAEAYCCNIELHFWRTGELLPAQPLAKILLEYGCKPEHVQQAQHIYEACHERLKAGEYRAEASLFGLAMLSEMHNS